MVNLPSRFHSVFDPLVTMTIGWPGGLAWLLVDLMDDAFITKNSNLVFLLEGLCSSNPCRFEFSVF